MREIRRALAGGIEDRTGLLSMAARLVSGRVERNGAWLRTTGFACLVLVLVECITGPILGLYYTPSPQSAYADIQAIEQNPFGRFLRGLHHWASTGLIVLALFTAARMFFGAEYKAGLNRRRDVVWIAALLFTQFVLLLQMTGHILPWDTNAAGTAGVEAGIAGNVWMIGPLVERFLLGGSATGAATLARWYGFHALVFPLALLLLVGVPLIAARLREADSPAGHENPAPTTPDSGTDAINRVSTTLDSYYPVHLAREMAVALVVFLVIAGLAWFGRTPLEKEATAANLDGYQAKAEWYVLPLHALTLIPPFNHVALEPVATVVLPGALFTMLILLPFIDRSPERALKRRPVAAAAAVGVIVSIGGLCAYSLIVERPQAVGEVAAESSRPPAAVSGPVNSALATQGSKVYAAQGCTGCHTIGGTGGKMGPDLSHAGRLHADRKWQIAHLIKPDSMTPNSQMPPYKQLSQSDLQALAEYLVSLK